MTFTVIYNNEREWVDLESMDELVFLNEKYGFKKMVVDICDMTITIIDD